MAFEESNLEKKLKYFKKNKLVKNILIVDGQPGCGKTLFNRIFNSFEKIELFRYSSEIENICSFYFHKKISSDAAKFFLKLMLMKIYTAK